MAERTFAKANGPQGEPRMRRAILMYGPSTLRFLRAAEDRSASASEAKDGRERPMRDLSSLATSFGAGFLQGGLKAALSDHAGPRLAL
jgi:hypothetical protein